MPLRLGNLRCGGGLLVGPSAGTLGSPPPLTYLWLCYRAQDMKDRRGETRRGRKGRARGLRLSLWQIRVIFLLFPLFNVKSAGKLGSSLQGQYYFQRGGVRRGPGLSIQFGIEGGLILLRNLFQFKYQTVKTELEDCPAQLPDH